MERSCLFEKDVASGFSRRSPQSLYLTFVRSNDFYVHKQWVSVLSWGVEFYILNF